MPALNLPALRFEAEAFRLGGEKILGRQSAGDAFLRAVLALPELERLCGTGPNVAAGQAMARMVGALRRDVKTEWVPIADQARLAATGALHFPDPTLTGQARARLTMGSAAYSLTGLTHTISSAGVMRTLADFPAAPLMEWDALICTSDAVRASVMEIIEEQEDFLAWRMPGGARPPRPQFPVIPLGVHAADFARTDEARQEARKALGLGAGDVAFLFVGRLSFHAKANPYPMYLALEEAARRTGKRIALIQCGWFANASIEKAFKASAEAHAPSVRHLWLDGRQAPQRARAWAAGDVFMSLSDNIQETFGLTPLEAMAAGLPVIVTDWDGYRQTVRHGETGIMVPTFAPAAPAGEDHAAAHAAETINYDHYLAHTARHIGMDLTALCDAACALATDADRRRTMGEAGRRLALAEFDWRHIIRRYIALWDELAAIRAAVPADDLRRMARASADRLDPFRLFANYPSRAISGESALRPRAGGGDFRKLLADPLFAFARETLPDDAALAALIAGLERNPRLSEAASEAGLDATTAILAATALVKLGVLDVA
jgi:alpha-maltose-1-phosphate synthase